MREGTLFELGSADEILRAADALREMGYERLVAYTPYAIPELEEKLGIKRTRVPWAILAMALVGCAVAFGILWGTNAYDYPLDVGGRPVNSLPADVPIMFETTVLFGSLTAFVLVFVRGGMPRLHAPIFEVEGIESVSVDRFWIGVEQRAPLEEAVLTRMSALGVRGVRRVGRET